MTNKIYCGNAVDILKTLPAQSIYTCVTSPPYYGLRDYGVEGQLGLEDSPDEYIANLVEVFREVKRVLKDDGTLWIVIADSYAGSGKGAWKNKNAQLEVYVPSPTDKEIKMPNTWDGIKLKDLIGIPWMLAFALRDDGWYLRQDIIWQKPNAMPESVRDRCTTSHEYVFLLSKSKKYYFDSDSIKEPAVTFDKKKRNRDLSKLNNTPGRTKMGGLTRNDYKYRNKRNVWQVNTQSYKEAHFATFPPELIEPCILAGCPAGEIVLDPFMGSGTTGYVAKKNDRNYIGIELNQDNIKLADKRIEAVKAQTTLY